MSASKNTVAFCRFALRHIPTGNLVRISKESNQGGDCCGEYKFELMLDDSEDYPVYTRTTVRKLEGVLARNTAWYNADYHSPMHGRVKPDDLEVVKYEVVTTTDIEPVAFNRIPTLYCVTTERKPALLLRRYAGRELPLEAHTFRAFLLPEGKSFEDMKQLENGQVCTTMGSFIHVYAVFKAPEEYELDFKGKPGFCAVTGDTL
jgi:hypothetical protein